MSFRKLIPKKKFDFCIQEFTKEGKAEEYMSLCMPFSKSLRAPDVYSTKNMQKYFEHFQLLTMIT
jgi:hypothetical protein